MRRRSVVGGACRQVAAAFAAILFATAALADARDDLASLWWLAGCWASESGEPGSGEQWLAPAGGTLLGVARTVRNGSTVDYEFMQIRIAAQRGVEFVALPAGQAETVFALADITATSVTFENPAHDFPTRIVYRQVEPDRLQASIEGTVDDEKRMFLFPMRRADCTAPPPPVGAERRQLLFSPVR